MSRSWKRRSKSQPDVDRSIMFPTPTFYERVLTDLPELFHKLAIKQSSLSEINGSNATVCEGFV